jgi:hypothetical protein
MSEFVETTIELMKSHSVDSFMKETIQRKDDPAGVLADLWHYCDHYGLDFFNIVADGELGPQKGTYEDCPSNIVSDLVEWCEINDFDWEFELEKAQFLIEMDTNGSLERVLQI